MEAIGFIGLGRMGRPMASNLCRKGFRLVVHDINAHAVSELELLQASAAKSPAEVARRSEIVVTMLPDPTVVSKVIGADDGVIANAKPGAVIMDMSTDRRACKKGPSPRPRVCGCTCRQAGQPC